MRPSSSCTSSKARYSSAPATAIGIVSAIAAPAALRVTWEGEGGHAGAVLMAGRRDALCAAAETVLAVEAFGACERQPGHRGHNGRLPGAPGRDQQHPRPRDPRDRRTGHRSRAERPGDRGDRAGSRRDRRAARRGGDRPVLERGPARASIGRGRRRDRSPPAMRQGYRTFP